MSDPREREPGLTPTLKRVADSVLALVENRVELMTVEWQEEKIRLWQAALFTSGVMVCAGMLLILLSLAILFLFWEHGRWFALGALLLAYGGAGYYCWRRLNQFLQNEAPFSATLEQFKKDREWLRKKH